ncbi:MarR family winged helix-turn-helix transcriptional regulator [Salinibacterium sp. NK8237]|uniref:MarR family winged helix-turn-helix transcriptional regulator n=1 Tax=Salinibacterium sp. NK8237 TaxID=2792038 RepID=UPI0018CD42CC|nr:MarR family transcriptional regulator [Salinibacterium sp. NK8237]MBH0130318.1 MarR family transcriptional regulator [Salinibacterium sp. NK8237]
MDSHDRVDRIQEEWRRERPDIDVSPQGIIGRLHQVANRLTAELNLVFEQHGLGEGEFDVLASLRRAGAPFERAPGELAQHTMVTTGAMTKRLDRLTEAGLVIRRPTDGDGRRRTVALTERGRAVIDAAFADHMANEQRLIGSIPEADRQALQSTLKNWLQQLD